MNSLKYILISSFLFIHTAISTSLFDEIPEEFQGAVQKITSLSTLNKFSKDSLDGDITAIVPAPFVYQALNQSLCDGKNGMYIGLLPESSVFLKPAQAMRMTYGRALGELLSYRLFDYLSLSRFVLPVKLFTIPRTIPLIDFHFSEEDKITYEYKENKGEIFIGSPFLPHTQAFVNFLENLETKDIPVVFSLEKDLRTISLIQALLGIGDTHLGNYLLNQKNQLIKIDNESASSNLPYEKVKAYAFKPFQTFGQEGKLPGDLAKWKEFFEDKYTFDEELIDLCHTLLKPSTWKELLNFELWDHKKGLDFYDIDSAIERVKKLLNDIEKAKEF